MGKISSHFRIGIITMLGKLGFSDQDIMAIGGWSSSAFDTRGSSTRSMINSTANINTKNATLMTTWTLVLLLQISSIDVTKNE